MLRKLKVIVALIAAVIVAASTQPVECAADIAMDVGIADLATLPYRRHMEYQADKEGAALTSANAMAGGLKALEKRSKEYSKEEYQRKYGKDADPKNANILLKGWWQIQKALDPHPSMKNRVDALTKMNHVERLETTELQFQR